MVSSFPLSSLEVNRYDNDDDDNNDNNDNEIKFILKELLVCYLAKIQCLLMLVDVKKVYYSSTGYLVEVTVGVKDEKTFRIKQCVKQQYGRTRQMKSR